VLVVVLAVDQRGQLLEVALGLVEGRLERAHLLVLVGAPVVVVLLLRVAPHEQRERRREQVGNGREQRAD
jgi:hypothetical protein